MTPDLLLCKTRSTCSACPWSTDSGCRLEALLDAAAPRQAPIPLATPAPAFAWSDAGLVFDDRLTA